MLLDRWRSFQCFQANAIEYFAVFVVGSCRTIKYTALKKVSRLCSASSGNCHFVSKLLALKKKKSIYSSDQYGKN